MHVYMYVYLCACNNFGKKVCLHLRYRSDFGQNDAEIRSLATMDRESMPYLVLFSGSPVRSNVSIDSIRLTVTTVVLLHCCRCCC